MAMRYEAENWLRAKAIATGLRIDDPHPVYFVLTIVPVRVTREMLKRYADHDITRHPLPTLDLSNWSFTLDDSISNH